jgi:hypothetical protein
MTEAEWLVCDDPLGMVLDLYSVPVATQRKWRLFSVACLRSVWPLLTDPGSKDAVLVADRAADGEVTPTELAAANRAAGAAWLTERRGGTRFAARAAEFATRDPVVLVSEVADLVRKAARACRLRPNPATTQAQCQLLRDLFGTLHFRPVTVEPGWLSSTVTELARGIYDERAFDRLPILADALQDAGCDDADILDHCRGAGPHVRGCWAVDRVLGTA